MSCPAVGEPTTGQGTPIQIAIVPTYEDGSTPDKLFWRVAVNDIDSDGDGLTDAEEFTLGTDPNSIDTDLDGIPDHLDPLPLTSATLANPDGTGLLSAQNTPLSLASGMIGRWNLEDHEILTTYPAGYTPFRYPDSSGNNFHATAFNVFPHPEGMISKATNNVGGFVSIPPSILTNRKIYTTAFWARLDSGCIAAANGAAVGLFSHHQRVPVYTNNVPNWGLYSEQLNGLWFEKSGSQELLRAGTYTFSNHDNNGVIAPGVATNTGLSILRPTGTADDGKWHHYTLVRNDAVTILYIDGILIGQATAAAANIPTNTNAGISLGRIKGPSPAATTNVTLHGTSPTRGRFDRLRLWSRVLTSTEALDLYREDADHDGIIDVIEDATRFWRDRNANSIIDPGEQSYNSSPFIWQSPSTDSDDDGLSNIQEQSIDTDPFNPDTDGDRMPDGWEVNNTLNPKVNDAAGNPDNDGLSNLDEYRYNTNPKVADTDHDGKTDVQEVAQDSDPNDTSDQGQAPAPDQKVSNLQVKAASGGTPAEGPDFDYTLKVEPQGILANALVIPSYDIKARAVSSTTLLALQANDVAETSQEFKKNYESLRVAVVSPKLEWKAVDDYANVDTHTDPWTNSTKGKRIFPDYKDPNSQQLRNSVQLIVSGVLPGMPIYVKAFDVDDSTKDSEYTSNGGSNIIDSNGDAGDDNLTDYLDTQKNGHFWTNNAWGSNTLQKPADNNGQAKFIFRVGMQPGNNYRVVASVNNEFMYAGVQTGNATAAKYLGPEVAQDGGASASPLLTVWRKLWIENDSMKAIDSYTGGDLKNDLIPADFESVTIRQVFASSSITTFYIPKITDGTSFTEPQNGKLKFPGSGNIFTSFQTIPSISSGVDAVQVGGNQAQIQPGAVFRLYDDDGFGLTGPTLPRIDLIADGVIKRAYKPAFIEVMDAEPWNDTKTVEFYRNHPPTVGNFVTGYDYGILDDALDTKLGGGQNLWCASVMVAYQPGSADSDPNDESFGVITGATVGDSLGFSGKARVSIIYSEVIRDQIDDLLRTGGVTSLEYEQRLRLTVAHELGHQPLYGMGEAAQHAEDGLMVDGGHAGIGGADTPFSAQSIKRFRGVNQWRQKN